MWLVDRNVEALSLFERRKNLQHITLVVSINCWSSTFIHWFTGTRRFYPLRVPVVVDQAHKRFYRYWEKWNNSNTHCREMIPVISWNYRGYFSILIVHYCQHISLYQSTVHDSLVITTHILHWFSLHFIVTVYIKPGSQHDGDGASVASRVSGRCWNRLNFHSSIASPASNQSDCWKI